MLQSEMGPFWFGWEKFITEIYEKKIKIISKKDKIASKYKGSIKGINGKKIIFDPINDAVKRGILISSGENWKVVESNLKKEYEHVTTSCGCPSGDAFNEKYGSYEKFISQKKPSLLQRLFSKKKK